MQLTRRKLLASTAALALATEAKGFYVGYDLAFSSIFNTPDAWVNMSDEQLNSLYSFLVAIQQQTANPNPNFLFNSNVVPANLKTAASWAQVYMALENSWANVNPNGTWFNASCSGAAGENQDKPNFQGSVWNSLIPPSAAGGTGAGPANSNLTWSPSPGTVTVTCPNHGMTPGAFIGGTLTSNGGIAAIVAKNINLLSQSGYINGTYFNVPFTGGSGSGFQGTVTVSGGKITAIIPTAMGSGYAFNDTLGVSNTSVGGTGSGFSYQIAQAGVVVSSASSSGPGSFNGTFGATIVDANTYTYPLASNPGSIGASKGITSISDNVLTLPDGLNTNLAMYAPNALNRHVHVSFWYNTVANADDFVAAFVQPASATTGTFQATMSSTTALKITSVTSGRIEEISLLTATDGTNSLPAGCTAIQVDGTPQGVGDYTISPPAAPGALTGTFTLTAKLPFAPAAGLTRALVISAIQNRLKWQLAWMKDTASVSSGVTFASIDILNETCLSPTSGDISLNGWRNKFDGTTGNSVWLTVADALFTGGSAATCSTSTSGGVTTLTIAGANGDGYFFPTDTVSGTDGSHSLPGGTTITQQLTGSPQGGNGTYIISPALVNDLGTFTLHATHATQDYRYLDWIVSLYDNAQQILVTGVGSFPNLKLAVLDFEVEKIGEVIDVKTVNGNNVNYADTSGTGFYNGANKTVFSGYSNAAPKIRRYQWLSFMVSSLGYQLDQVGMQAHLYNDRGMDLEGVRYWMYLLTRWNLEPTIRELNVRQTGWTYGNGKPSSQNASPNFSPQYHGGAITSAGVVQPSYADNTNRLQAYLAWNVYVFLNTVLQSSKMKTISFWTNATDVGGQTGETLMGQTFWVVNNKNADAIMPAYFGAAAALMNNVDPAFRSIPDIARMDFCFQLPYFCTLLGSPVIDYQSGFVGYGIQNLGTSGGFSAPVSYFSFKGRGNAPDTMLTGAWRINWQGFATPAATTYIWQAYTAAGDIQSLYIKTDGFLYFAASRVTGGVATVVSEIKIVSGSISTTLRNCVELVRNGNTAGVSTFVASINGGADFPMTMLATLPAPTSIAVCSDMNGSNSLNTGGSAGVQAGRVAFVDWIGQGTVKQNPIGTQSNAAPLQRPYFPNNGSAPNTINFWTPENGPNGISVTP